MLRIELCLCVLALITAFIYPQLGSRWFEKIERRFAALARRRTLSVILVGLLALGLRLAVLPIEPIPEPIIHDEFGYLLAADTFAHGRLTNPTHPMWMHFESFSILQKPTYQCFAQPGQGTMLAVGQLIFGHPFWGVWLSVGFMCAAICWMLQAWLPAHWALLGAILVLLRYAVFSYWANSYWGGALGAFGGALVLGALPRIKRSQRVRDALWMALGLAILANNRPYEGFVFSLPVAVALFSWMLSRGAPSWQLSMRRVVLPLAACLAIAAGAMAYYFWRVTGNPLRMPYQVERQTYAVSPLMLWEPVHPQPAYRHEAMRKMYVDEEFVGYNFFRTAVGQLLKTYMAWSFYLGPVLTFPLLMLIFALPSDFSVRQIDRRTRFLLALLAVSIIGLALETFYNPHYSSPLTGVVIALVILATRRLQFWKPRNRPTGLFLARVIPVICVFMFALRAAATPLHIPLSEFYEFGWYQKGSHSFGRAVIQQELQRSPGNHLVIVRYKPDHEPFAEWVYNDADIDHSKIVWAREMSPAENAGLVQYFLEREVWLLEADEQPPKLSPYPRSQTHLLTRKDMQMQILKSENAPQP